MDSSINSVERVGKTVEHAIADALEILGAVREDVDVQIIDKGASGFLGLIGSRPARVSVKRKLDPIEAVEQFLLEVTSAMGVPVKVTSSRKDRHLYVNLVGQNVGVLIGKRGQTLDSLQYLTNLAANRSGAPEFSVILDTENYRKRRKETLEALAMSLARKAKSTQKSVILEPMTRYERHVIHTVLQRVSGIRTYSEGNEPHRNVVIAPK